MLAQLQSKQNGANQLLPASYFQCSWFLLVITVVQFSDTSGNFHLIVFNYNDYAVSPIIKCFPYVRHNKIIISPSAPISTLIQLLGGVKCVCLGSKGTATNTSLNIPRKRHSGTAVKLPRVWSCAARLSCSAGHSHISRGTVRTQGYVKQRCSCLQDNHQ